MGKLNFNFKEGGQISTRLVEKRPEEILELKKLLEEYGKYMYEELGLTAGKDLFFKELKDLPGKSYLPPNGTFILASYGQQFAGCVGIKKWENKSCEMKRMFIRGLYRKKGIGKFLCTQVINWAAKYGYTKILLDTNQEMGEAVLLYESFGFRRIAPYCVNENPNSIFMEYRIE